LEGTMKKTTLARSKKVPQPFNVIEKLSLAFLDFLIGFLNEECN